MVKTSRNEIFIIKTKGLEDLNVPLKMTRLKKLCEDINAAQNKIRFDYVFVGEQEFENFFPNSLRGLTGNILNYKDKINGNYRAVQL